MKAQKSPGHKLAIWPITQPAIWSWHTQAVPTANQRQTSPAVALTKSKGKHKAKGSNGTLERILAEISHSSLKTHTAIGIESLLPPKARAESSAVQRAAVLDWRGNIWTIPFSEINPLKNTHNFNLKTPSCNSQAVFQLQTLWILALKTQQHNCSSLGRQKLKEGVAGKHLH